MQTSDDRIDDIVNMIDSFMEKDGGHMNIKVKKDGNIKTDKKNSKTVSVSKSLDCMEGKTACSVPTLFEGMDNLEDEEKHIDN